MIVKGNRTFGEYHTWVKLTQLGKTLVLIYRNQD